jgi:hypothetical protein
MLGLTNGELFVVGFIFLSVVSAGWWPRAGASIGRALGGPEDPPAPPG